MFHRFDAYIDEPDRQDALPPPPILGRNSFGGRTLLSDNKFRLICLSTALPLPREFLNHRRHKKHKGDGAGKSLRFVCFVPFVVPTNFQNGPSSPATFKKKRASLDVRPRK